MSKTKTQYKGYRVEKKIEKFIRAMGLEAYRVPVSGIANGHKGDVVFTINGTRCVLEVKARHSLNRLYKYQPPYVMFAREASERGNNKILIMSLYDYIQTIKKLNKAGENKIIKKEENIFDVLSVFNDIPVVHVKKIPAYLQKWLEQAYRERAVLVVKANYKQPLVVLKKYD